jgi:hypothetical protein
MTSSRYRLLLIAGLVLMVLGAIDPMEGSVVILAGSAFAALAAWFGHLQRATAIVTAFVLIAIGVATLFGFSAVGGIGGNTGRSMWWMLTMVPYPVGWIVGLVAVISSLRAPRPATA